ARVRRPTCSGAEGWSRSLATRRDTSSRRPRAWATRGSTATAVSPARRPRPGRSSRRRSASTSCSPSSRRGGSLTAEMRTELSQALRAGRTREAARCAGRLARAGAMDDVVAATLYLHGAKDAPERVAADEWLEATGRWEQACVALRIATRDGLADASLWLEL